MKIGRKKAAPAPAAGTPSQGPGQGPAQGPGQGAGQGAGKGPAARVQQAEKEIKQLRRRIKALEKEMQESRQLNKRLAEITDVVAEVLLPAEQRDDERLRAVLARYDAGV